MGYGGIAESSIGEITELDAPAPRHLVVTRALGYEAESEANRRGARSDWNEASW